MTQPLSELEQRYGFELPFLRRKPRIFLVGNQEKSGLDEHRWYQATVYVVQLIFANEKIPFGLNMNWFEGAYYYFEGPREGIKFSEQGWAEFDKLIRAAKDTWEDDQSILHPEEVKALFAEYPPIRWYAIPDATSTDRPFFDRALNQFIADWTRRDENNAKVQEALRSIASTLGIHFR